MLAEWMKGAERNLKYQKLHWILYKNKLPTKYSLLSLFGDNRNDRHSTRMQRYTFLLSSTYSNAQLQSISLSQGGDRWRTFILEGEKGSQEREMTQEGPKRTLKRAKYWNNLRCIQIFFYSLYKGILMKINIEKQETTTTLKLHIKQWFGWLLIKHLILRENTLKGE